MKYNVHVCTPLFMLICFKQFVKVVPNWKDDFPTAPYNQSKATYVHYKQMLISKVIVIFCI